jgi:hypothetical protein
MPIDWTQMLSNPITQLNRWPNRLLYVEGRERLVNRGFQNALGEAVILV